MKFIRKQMVANVLSVLLLLITSCASLSAQCAHDTSNDGIEPLVNSIAKTVYAFAWPTATYRSVCLNDVQPVAGGYDVLVKLSGLSGIDNSDLWVLLAITIRNGEVKDIQVRNHNAFWVAPFETSKALANAAAAAAKQYDDQKHPGTPQTSNVQAANGACLTNNTAGTITLEYRWGGDDWKQAKLGPGDRYRFWWTYGSGPHTIPALNIRYSDDFSPAYSERDYSLESIPTTMPVACSQARNYNFAMDGSKILLYDGAN